MSEYKYVCHGNEVQYEDIEELSVNDSSETFGWIADEWRRLYDEVISVAINKIISNNLQV